MTNEGAQAPTIRGATKPRFQPMLPRSSGDASFAPLLGARWRRLPRHRPLWALNRRQGVPDDVPQDEPLGRSHAEIHRNLRPLEGIADLVLAQSTEFHAVHGHRDSAHLVPEEGVADDFEADGPTADGPRRGGHHRSNRVFPSSMRQNSGRHGCRQTG